MFSSLQTLKINPLRLTIGDLTIKMCVCCEDYLMYTNIFKRLLSNT